jgi:uncharacterized protein YjbI with pentapeptide repeats
VQLQGANMLVAVLHGANMFGVLMQGADLSSATLQGAILTHAHLQGAILRDADLEGVDMQYANLQRADMSGARIRAADLRGSSIWQTSTPMRESLQLADLSGIVVREVDEEERKTIRSWVDRIDDERIKRQVLEAIDPLFNPAEAQRWGSTPERQTWQAYFTASQSVPQDAYVKDLTEHLMSLMCKSRFGNGAVATGIAQRAQGAMFRGNVTAIYDRLRGGACPAALNVSPRLLQQMATAIDNLTGK